MRTATAALLAALLLGAAPATVPSSQPSAGQEARAHWPVPGADDAAQRLIDRGVMMLFAFDVAEARVAFGQALARNPNLVLAYWGEAEADTIDINLPQTEAGDKRGLAAATEGRRHLANASELERVLVDAIAKRYGSGSKKDRFARYADALSAWTKTHRDDANVLAVAAYAIWNAEDALLDAHDAPTAKANEMVADLDAALALDPINLGAHHLRIHLLESLHRAHDAIPDADALSSYVYPPGTSHLPHMSGHIWSRVGDYGRLVDDNEHAVANDQSWFAQGNGPGQEYMKFYHDHDVDFVLYGLTTLGQADQARAFAQHEDELMQLKAALRLRDETRVLQLTRATSTGYDAFARAIASARQGEVRSARAALTKDGNANRTAIGDAVIALAQHDSAAAVSAYARAYDHTKNDALGDPKNSWPTPIGEGYGVALLAAGKAAEAEAVFTDELKRYPNDPRLEWGLAEALKTQGKDDAAARAAYHAHWQGSRDLTVGDLG